MLTVEAEWLVSRETKHALAHADGPQAYVPFEVHPALTEAEELRRGVLPEVSFFFFFLFPPRSLTCQPKLPIAAISADS